MTVEERTWAYVGPTLAETSDGYASMTLTPGIVMPNARSFRVQVYICVHDRSVPLAARWFDNAAADTYEDVQAIALAWAKGKVEYYTCFRQ